MREPLPSVAQTWRLLPYDVGRSDRHFALSDALVRTVREPTLWWHATDQPTLILGAGQTWDQVDRRACSQAKILVIRRHAGGTAVFAASGVLGLDIALPRDHPLALPDIVEAYRWLGEVWVETTRLLGTDSKLVTIAAARSAAKEAPVQSAIRLACFGSLSPYEVVADGRKLVGLAQVRRRAGILLQSAIHLHFNAQALAALLPGTDGQRTVETLQRAAVGLDELCDPVPTDDYVVQTFQTVLARTLNIRLRPDSWSESELRHAEELQGTLAPR